MYYNYRLDISNVMRRCYAGSGIYRPYAPFDLATAFETAYFWPGLEKCFGEVCRVLRPGGVFMICIESDGTDVLRLPSAI